jgi:hypothetical protein
VRSFSREWIGYCVRKAILPVSLPLRTNSDRLVEKSVASLETGPFENVRVRPGPYASYHLRTRL